jgi:hypothetical protein
MIIVQRARIENASRRVTGSPTVSGTRAKPAATIAAARQNNTLLRWTSSPGRKANEHNPGSIEHWIRAASVGGASALPGPDEPATESTSVNKERPQAPRSGVGDADDFSGEVRLRHQSRFRPRLLAMSQRLLQKTIVL